VQPADQASKEAEQIEGSSAQLQRQEVITILAEAMSKAAAGRAQVNLKAPKVTLLAEVIPVMLSGRWRPLLGLSVVQTDRLISVKGKGLQVRSVSK